MSILDQNEEKLEEICNKYNIKYNTLYDIALKETSKLLYRGIKKHGFTAIWKDYKPEALEIIERYIRIYKKKE